MLPLILFLVVLLPLCWLVSEFQDRQWLRILLGVVALAMSYFVAVGVGTLQQLNYNAHYGAASADLIETVIANIENGNQDELVRELKQLNQDFHPTYENTANYGGLVRDFVGRMKAETPPTNSTADGESPSG